jgi:hypothetical protein
MPLAEALARLKECDVMLDVVTPPYPCIGRGKLRVVRVVADDSRLRLSASYEDYERLDRPTAKP